ncbi:helix-turn-helix transcriptional regulator [Ochrobactrum sp. SSR]|uniref:helix-turn-helix transcriptional regulator n=1 Tax=Hyphomicrobiales TaxID=356 RepID=UPI00352FFDE4
MSSELSSATGATPYQWLLDFRISKAQEMLKRGMPLAQVALECRFADQGHLSRVFKSKCGVSPMLWLTSMR